MGRLGQRRLKQIYRSAPPPAASIDATHGSALAHNPFVPLVAILRPGDDGHKRRKGRNPRTALPLATIDAADPTRRAISGEGSEPKPSARPNLRVRRLELPD